LPKYINIRIINKGNNIKQVYQIIYKSQLLHCLEVLDLEDYTYISVSIQCTYFLEMHNNMPVYISYL